MENFIIFNLCVIVVLTNANPVYACTTPQWQSGTCVNIKLCPRLYRMDQQLNRPWEHTEFLRNSFCGWDAFNNAKVCCEQSQISNVKQSIDVRNHPNFYLLNNFQCGRNKPTIVPAVAGGNKTQPADYPWMALLGYVDWQMVPKWECGGSVINSRYILTAAHCVTYPGKNLKFVRIGEHNLNTATDCSTTSYICNPKYQDILIEPPVIPHEEYNIKPLFNDIALIRLKEPIKHELFRPICLPFYSASQIPDRFTVAGWGFFDDRKLQSKILQEAHLSLYPHDRCVSVYQNQKRGWPIWDKQICASGDIGVNTCQGDSGGPLQSWQLYNDQSVRAVQHGIVSLSSEQCGNNMGFPSIFTRVDSYLDWILNNIRA